MTTVTGWLRREFTFDMFADLTPVEPRFIQNRDGSVTLVFDTDMDAETVAAVKRRLESINDVDGVIRDDLASALDTLTSARATFGAIRGKSNVDIGPKDVKDIAAELARLVRVWRQLVRVSIGHYDGTD